MDRARIALVCQHLDCLSMLGRTAVYTGVKTIEVREYPVPDPGPGEIILRITQAGLCGSDLHIWRGELGEPAPGGRPLGHEGLATVHQVPAPPAHRARCAGPNRTVRPA